MMDTTLEYALMMKGANEIIDVWEFSNGDWFFSQDNNNPLSWGVTVWVDSFHLAEDTRCVIPLPRQDQLQDMVVCSKKHENLMYHEIAYFILQDFADWFQSCDHYENMMTMDSREKITLCWVMHVNHSKVWDGSEWVSA